MSLEEGRVVICLKLHDIFVLVTEIFFQIWSFHASIEIFYILDKVEEVYP